MVAKFVGTIALETDQLKSSADLPRAKPNPVTITSKKNNQRATYHNKITIRLTGMCTCKVKKYLGLLTYKLDYTKHIIR